MLHYNIILGHKSCITEFFSVDSLYPDLHITRCDVLGVYKECFSQLPLGMPIPKYILHTFSSICTGQLFDDLSYGKFKTMSAALTWPKND